MESWKQELTSTSGGLQRAGSSASVVIDLPELVDPRKLPSSQYKGVVAQPNGRWGAQIYENHHRFWLGTFNNEPEAARAYHVAVQRFRGGEAITNSTHLSISNAAESTFIQSHSRDEIVDMLRRHTYQDELERSRNSYKPTQNTLPSLTQKMVLEPLFEKAVTPSDVGKLNRLVIPKQKAEKHLPQPGSGKGLLLSLVDGCSGAVWRIRYSYWNSSQSYVLTKGWSRFVREKGLKAGDVVTFMRSTGPEKQLYIDRRVARSKVEMTTPVVGPVMLFGVNICGLTGRLKNSHRQICLGGNG